MFFGGSKVAVRIRKSFGSTTLPRAAQTLNLFYILVFLHKVSFEKRICFLKKKEKEERRGEKKKENLEDH